MTVSIGIARLAAACAVVFAMLIAPASAQTTLGDMNEEELGAFIREYILANPEIIAEASDRYFQMREERIAAESQAALEENWDAIVNNPEALSAGDPDASVTVVEFFDYNCSFCRLATPSILAMLDKEEDVRFVFLEFPIRGEDSIEVAKAAMAARNQDKYLEFHGALMVSEGRLDLERAEEIAKNVGLNVKQLRKDMDDPKIDEVFKANDELARALYVDGTPAFLIGDEIVRGWPGQAEFRELIATARNTEETVSAE